MFIISKCSSSTPSLVGGGLLCAPVDQLSSFKTVEGVCLDGTNKIETLPFKMLVICTTSGQKLPRVDKAVIEGWAV